MSEVQHGLHTLRSHGLTVAKRHKYDWLMLVLLAVVDVILYEIHPFQHFIGKDTMVNLRYPIKPDIVPFWAVPLYAVLLPMVIFIFIYFQRRNIYDLHDAILGLSFSILLTAVITNALQNIAGRPRPNFFWQCFPDGIEACFIYLQSAANHIAETGFVLACCLPKLYLIVIYDRWGNAICHGNKDVSKKARESFPSGHTSWTFAGLGFLALYLAGKANTFNHEGHISKLCVFFLPLLAAAVLAISRVDDYTHHWQDVLTGALIGLVVAVFCYLHFYPPPHHPEGGVPYSYFRALEESYANRRGNSARSTETQVEA